MTKSNGTLRLLTWVALAFALVASLGASSVLAESYGASGPYLPLGGLERVIGPIIPANGIASTFRSELSAGVSGCNLVAAKLVGTRSRELNLEKASPLDNAPLRYDANAILRIWRLGLRATYTNFQTSSRHRNLGQVDFTGLTLGADADVVQFPWLSLGASFDAYLFDPYFQGVVHDPPDSASSVTLTVKGQKPLTVGGYLRYIPPEILGFPMHVEAWFKAPVGGSKFTTYGCSLVFRPQIYRFDVAAKVIAQKAYLKFNSSPQAQLSDSVPVQNWEVDMEWNLLGGEFVVYF